jgi:hypothetical protein
LSQINTATTPTNDDPAAATMSLEERRRIIEEIRAFNPTAHPEFLAGFELEALRDYRDHLKHARQKHVRLPGWVQRRNSALAEARRSLQKVA